MEIRRGLAAQRPDAFLPELAASLNNLGNVLSDLGQREPLPATLGSPNLPLSPSIRLAISISVRPVFDVQIERRVRLTFSETLSLEPNAKTPALVRLDVQAFWTRFFIPNA